MSSGDGESSVVMRPRADGGQAPKKPPPAIEWRAWILPGGDVRVLPKHCLHTEYAAEAFGYDPDAPRKGDAQDAAIAAGWIRVGLNPLHRELYAQLSLEAATLDSVRGLEAILTDRFPDKYSLDAGSIVVRSGGLDEFLMTLAEVADHIVHRRFVVETGPTP